MSYTPVHSFIFFQIINLTAILYSDKEIENNFIIIFVLLFFDFKEFSKFCNLI